MAETKYIFVTGGVASSLGKGIISSSIGKLLQARGYNITIQKFDPYINIDPGTLNPYEHGECYVTVDGQETDLDLVHYQEVSGLLFLFHRPDHLHRHRLRLQRVPALHKSRSKKVHLHGPFTRRGAAQKRL